MLYTNALSYNYASHSGVLVAVQLWQMPRFDLVLHTSLATMKWLCCTSVFRYEQVYWAFSSFCSSTQTDCVRIHCLYNCVCGLLLKGYITTFSSKGQINTGLRPRIKAPRTMDPRTRDPRTKSVESCIALHKLKYIYTGNLCPCYKPKLTYVLYVMQTEGFIYSRQHYFKLSSQLHFSMQWGDALLGSCKTLLLHNWFSLL